jgi:hypothetical protein
VPDHAVVDRFRREAGLSVADLWLRYFALGGVETPRRLESYLVGELDLESSQYDVLAHALNERLVEIGKSDNCPYRGE